jgi:hypothetical protein
MRKKTLLSLAIAVVVTGVAAATAFGIVIRAGEMIITAQGGFTPKVLPKHEDAPITLHGGGNITTISGDLPPILKILSIEFDRHGHVETRGLPVCTAAKLQATTTASARKACPGAIVGKGDGTAVIQFPESRPLRLTSPITIFNGPRKNGDPTVLAHAYLQSPVSTAFVVPVVIETIHDGVYGYRTKGTIPKIAGGFGVPVAGHLTIGRTWTFKGHHYSYINARCETGHLQAKGEFTFADGTFLTGSFLKRCGVRGG